MYSTTFTGIRYLNQFFEVT